ncbi:MAG: hypothetical protein ACM3XM_13400 [Mycobacterium leprae]
MAQSTIPAGLRERWSHLDRDLLFLPKLDRMRVEQEEYSLEVIEFVRVSPVDEEVTVPSAPEVPETDVRELAPWSDAEADQLQMWELVNSVVEGNRVTRTCPECGGSKVLTCSRCHGHGHVECGFCFGSGSRSCSHCGGSGRVMHNHTRTNPDGTTSVETEWHTCHHCGGSGRERCGSCGGSGRVRCHHCGGSGLVQCEYCSPAGTVDTYIRRVFRETTVKERLLPISLPDYPEPIVLEHGYVSLNPRELLVPYDSVADQARLTERGIDAPDARLFFVRSATVTLHSVRDAVTGELAATFIAGEPEPIFTLHATVLDSQWSPDQEQRRALWASILYVLAPVVLLLGWFGVRQPGIAFWVAVLLAGVALILKRNPVQAFRLAFLDVRCAAHARTATTRCPTCGKDLCYECLIPSIRCPACGSVVSKAVTHLIEDGRWVEAHSADPSAGS